MTDNDVATMHEKVDNAHKGRMKAFEYVKRQLERTRLSERADKKMCAHRTFLGRMRATSCEEKVRPGHVACLEIVEAGALLLHGV